MGISLEEWSQGARATQSTKGHEGEENVQFLGSKGRGCEIEPELIASKITLEAGGYVHTSAKTFKSIANFRTQELTAQT